jgi:DNA/RNA endonuclease YhcR with UshA esterase domain
MKNLLMTTIFLSLSSAVGAQTLDMVRAHDAIRYAGEYAIVCGVIVGAKYLKDSKGAPTFLNFDKPYPNHDFSAVIFGKNRKNFKLKPETLTGHEVCVAGKVQVYKGKAQIEVVKEIQLSVKPPD